jgi:hypothetical protein
VHFSHEDRGRSLAEMAQRDLDAALQLLTDRAQYITGSSGAAIALRRSGSNDMLCRASTGANAPELGTLLSTEFGLSGESVRTRRALRCDDAERDARVNHDVCREVGIASVVVMPVVHDDEVLGVFELFSGKAHAFGERDLSALRRLSEMVETAVRLAQSAEGLPERWKTAQPAADALGTSLAEPVVSSSAPTGEEQHPQRVGDSFRNEKRIDRETDLPLTGLSLSASHFEDPIVEVETEFGPTAKAVVAMTADLPKICIDRPGSLPPLAEDPAMASALKKPLLWSAAASPTGEATNSAEVDRSHVPAVLRNLRKCEACGFPVSAERALCVECEEKKWRGQLRPRATTAASPSGSAAAAAPAPERKPDADQKASHSVGDAAKASPKVAEKDAAAKEPTARNEESAELKIIPAQAAPIAKAAVASLSSATQAAAPLPLLSSPSMPQAPMNEAAESRPGLDIAPVLFSAGLEPSQSWLGRNKYVLAAMLVIAGAIAAILLLR